MYTKTQAGYSIIEVMVAITVLLLAIVGPLTIAAKGLQSSYYARDQVTAYMLAQEGIEGVTAYRNEQLLAAFNAGNLSNTWNWASETGTFADCYETEGCNFDFTSTDITASLVACDPVSNCLLDYNSSSIPARYHVNNGTATDDSPFTRRVYLTTVNAEEIIVRSEVTWLPGIFSTQQTVTLTTSLFNIYGT